MRRAPTLLLLVLAAVPAGAHHRQTPPIVQVTSSGDAFLPRVPAFRGRLVLALDTPGGREIFRREHGSVDVVTLTALTTQGTNENPAASATGKVVAWDSDGNLLGAGDPGRQVYVLAGQTITQVAHDPTGTSTNPALNARGTRLAFQSSGDLAGAGNGGTLQIFLRNPDGVLVQVSHGAGASRNPVLDRTGQVLAFESTTDPLTGTDTGVAQIWLAAFGVAPRRLTDGLGPSRRPTVSPRGRFVAFESTADLAGSGDDTRVPQVFVYDRMSDNFARVTNETGGCAGPSVDETPGDWRVVFVCSGQGYLHLLHADQRKRLPIDDGTTPQAVAELGNFFVMVTTTADLVMGGTASNFRLYQLNLFKRPAIEVSGTATWFPTAGFRP